jgi:glycosyltransferase involved in cell wall biosynthesis
MGEKINELTVVCCTANRQEQIIDFIQEWNARKIRAKLLVVENSTTEATITKLTELYGALTDVKIVRSHPPGLSRARNVALSIVDSKYIAFTDDDCRVHENWEFEILNAFSEYDPDAIFGTVNAVWPQGFNPKSLTASMKASLAITDLGSRARRLGSWEFGVGANMCFKTSSIQNLKFDEHLGRSGSFLMSNEDLIFIDKLRDAQKRIYFVPEIIVNHLVDAERLTPSWFLSRFAWQAVSDVFSATTSPSELQKEIVKNYGGTVQSLIEDTWNNLDVRISTIRALLEVSLGSPESFPKTSFSLNEEEIETKPYYSVTPSKKYLLVELGGFHSFLTSAISNEDTFSLLDNRNPWYFTRDEFEKKLSKIALSLNANTEIRKIIFITVDPFLQDHLVHSLIDFISGVNAGVEIILHRKPEVENQLKNLKLLSQSAKISVFSEKLYEALKQIDIEPTKLPVVGSFYNPRFQTSSNVLGAPIQLAIFGELRETQLISYLRNQIRQSQDSLKNTIISFNCGTFDSTIYRGLRELKKEFPTIIDTENFMFLKTGEDYRALAPNVYQALIQKCNFVLKLQFSERMASSAVVHDAFVLGKPVVALRDTEAGLQVEKVTPELVFEEHENFFPFLRSIVSKKSFSEKLHRNAKQNVSDLRRIILS